MHRRLSRSLAAVGGAALALSLLAPTAVVAQEDQGDTFAVMVPSRAGDIEIDIQVYRPAGASEQNPVPVLLHSHGWGGSKTSGSGAFQEEQAAGYGVVSISQRGHGASGGLRNVEDPEFEGQDMMAVVDYIATELDWVAREDVADDPFADVGGDIMLGAWGGSYGGGYQYVLAGSEMMEYGATRMDVMAPDITWHDLNQALAPQDVPRSAWLTLLYATAATTVEPYISEGFAYGVATGQYADGTVPGVHDLKAEFATHGPAGYVDAQDADGDGDTTDIVTFDIPMLITQGFSDNLFNFTEAWDNFHISLTPEAQERSILVGHNGGHALPNAYPAGYVSGGDECGGKSTANRLEFFTAAFEGRDTRTLGDGEQYHFTTASGECFRFDADEVTATEAAPFEVDPTGTLGPATGSASMFGAPIHLELAEGPFTFGGVPELEATLYGLGYEQRVFFALSKGPSGITGTDPRPQVIQNNTIPFRMAGPVPALGTDIAIDLAGVADTIDEGESLYLTISPFSDMYFGHGSRTPGGVGFTDVSVSLPVIDAGVAPDAG